jgi:hypothetical protein
MVTFINNNNSCNFFSCDSHSIFLCTSQDYNFFQDEVIGIMHNPQSGGPGFDIGMCFPGQFGKCLRDTPYPLIVGHTLYGCSIET